MYGRACTLVTKRLAVMSEVAEGQQETAFLTSVSADCRPSSVLVLNSSRWYFARQSASNSRFANASHACTSKMDSAVWFFGATKLP